MQYRDEDRPRQRGLFYVMTFPSMFECPQCGVVVDSYSKKRGTCRSCSLQWWWEITGVVPVMSIVLVWDDPVLSMTEAEKTLMRELTD